MRKLDWIALGFAFGLMGWLLPGAAWAEVKQKEFVENFEQAEVGSEPANIMVLEGAFSVQEAEGKKALVLPGEPVGDFGFLFGPRMKPPVMISATITAEKKGRRSPRFGIGWGGQNGLKLFANPATKKLEFFDNQTKLEEANLSWKSGKQQHLMLALYEQEGEWWVKAVAGVALEQLKEKGEGSTVFETKLPNPPRAGRASVWAQPFSGLPIRVEELKVHEM